VSERALILRGEGMREVLRREVLRGEAREVVRGMG
jgi:hypothetical protein